MTMMGMRRCGERWAESCLRPRASTSTRDTVCARRGKRARPLACKPAAPLLPKARAHAALHGGRAARIFIPKRVTRARELPRGALTLELCRLEVYRVKVDRVQVYQLKAYLVEHIALSVGGPT